MNEGRANLARVMRRDVGGHANGDPRGAIREQIRKAARQHEGFFFTAVVGFAEVDRVVLDAVEHGLGHRREAGLGVPHGGGVITVDVAEVALAIDLGIARSEFLREAHQRVVNRLIAVRVIFADDVADDAGAFLEARLGVEFELAHRVQKPAVDGLEAVAHIRERPGGDGGQGIGEVTLAQRLSEVGIANGARGRRR